MRIDFITIVIIIANVVMSLKGFNDFAFFEKYKFNIGGLRRGENTRFITSGFLHVDQMHLFFFFEILLVFRLQIIV